MILDSGERTVYETGAVRDVQEGKGRCDLMPLEVVAELLEDNVIDSIGLFKKHGSLNYLYSCLRIFQNERSHFKSIEEMMLDAAIHFEEGAKKYGENNWQKGIPLHSYIDSGIRHYLKFRAGILDEPHGRAFVWNILCAIWTVENKPELDDFTHREEDEKVMKAVMAEMMKPIDNAKLTVIDAVAKDHAEHFWECRR